MPCILTICKVKCLVLGRIRGKMKGEQLRTKFSLIIVNFPLCKTKASNTPFSSSPWCWGRTCQTLAQVLRPLAIALLLLFVFTPLARYSKEKGIPVWLTFSGALVVVVLLLSFAGSFLHVDDTPYGQKTHPTLRLLINSNISMRMNEWKGQEA